MSTLRLAVLPPAERRRSEAVMPGWRHLRVVLVDEGFGDPARDASDEVLAGPGRAADGAGGEIEPGARAVAPTGDRSGTGTCSGTEVGSPLESGPPREVGAPAEVVAPTEVGPPMEDGSHFGGEAAIEGVVDATPGTGLVVDPGADAVRVLGGGTRRRGRWRV